MNNAEIIQGLEVVKDECGKRLDEGYQWICQQIDEAIEALKSEPCEDTISRQAAIDAILIKYTEYERLKMLHFTPNIIKQECADLLTDLPSIQPIRPRGIGLSHNRMME